MSAYTLGTYIGYAVLIAAVVWEVRKWVKK
jgi:hypothetical protein